MDSRCNSAGAPNVRRKLGWQVKSSVRAILFEDRLQRSVGRGGNNTMRSPYLFVLDQTLMIAMLLPSFGR